MPATPIDKKLWPLLILDVLQRHAGEGAERNEAGERFLTQKQILGFLRSDYGVETQRKAVSDNLVRLYDAALVCPELGLELEFLASERRSAPDASLSDDMQLVRKGWRLVPNHDFNTSEIRMLVDTVIASSVIPPTQAEQLINRLVKLSPDKITPPDIRREGHLPAVNKSFFWNIELLNEAIQQGGRVRFVLGAFGQDGKLHREQPDGSVRKHTVVPVEMLISKGHYYLIAHFPHDQEIYKFRIDLMQDIESLDAKDEAVGTAAGEGGEHASKINVLKYRE